MLFLKGRHTSLVLSASTGRGAHSPRMLESCPTSCGYPPGLQLLDETDKISISPRLRLTQRAGDRIYREVFWGGFSRYVADPDGTHAPGITLTRSPMFDAATT